MTAPTFTCDRCGEDEESPGDLRAPSDGFIAHRRPDGWSKVLSRLLCSDCQWTVADDIDNYQSPTNESQSDMNEQYLEIGGQRMTQAQFDAARHPLLNPNPGDVDWEATFAGEGAPTREDEESNDRVSDSDHVEVATPSPVSDTVTIELSREDAEWWTSGHDFTSTQHDRLGRACRAALDSPVEAEDIPDSVPKGAVPFTGWVAQDAGSVVTTWTPSGKKWTWEDRSALDELGLPHPPVEASDEGSDQPQPGEPTMDLTEGRLLPHLPQHGNLHPIPPDVEATLDELTQPAAPSLCDGRCLTAGDLGASGVNPGMMAYPDPWCSLHGVIGEMDPDADTLRFMVVEHKRTADRIEELEGAIRAHRDHAVGFEVHRLMDGMELAWVVIANSYEGNWDSAPAKWREAAERWRDEHWHPALDRNVAGAAEGET